MVAGDGRKAYEAYKAALEEQGRGALPGWSALAQGQQDAWDEAAWAAQRGGDGHRRPGEGVEEARRRYVEERMALISIPLKGDRAKLAEEARREIPEDGRAAGGGRVWPAPWDRYAASVRQQSGWIDEAARAAAGLERIGTVPAEPEPTDDTLSILCCLAYHGEGNAPAHVTQEQTWGWRRVAALAAGKERPSAGQCREAWSGTGCEGADDAEGWGRVAVLLATRGKA